MGAFRWKSGGLCFVHLAMEIILPPLRPIQLRLNVASLARGGQTRFQIADKPASSQVNHLTDGSWRWPLSWLAGCFEQSSCRASRIHLTASIGFECISRAENPVRLLLLLLFPLEANERKETQSECPSGLGGSEINPRRVK